MSAAVAVWLADLTPDERAMVNALREIVIAAAPGLIEEIKWNAPSFRDGADHKVTFGIERKGGVRMVLHRGVAKKDLGDWAFDDPERLAAWPEPDRGVVRLSTLTDVEERYDALRDLVSRWIAATHVSRRGR